MTIALLRAIVTVAETDEVAPDLESGGAVLFVGFILVGIVAAIAAAGLARRSRAREDEE